MKTIHKMRYITVLVFIFLASAVLAQRNENLIVSISKETPGKDSCCIYDLAIRNKTDSILCILHSINIRLTFIEPIGLALYRKNKKKEDYTFDYCFEDTAYTRESSPEWGQLVLPYQTLNFKIKIVPTNENKEKTLQFEYLYLSDLSYRHFMQEMKQVGSWYNKYRRIEASLNLPN